MVATLDHALLAGFGTDRLRCQEAMKTADKEHPNRWANVPSNRALGAGGQNRSCSITWAAKPEKFEPKGRCFFLISTFIEALIGKVNCYLISPVTRVISMGRRNTKLQPTCH